MIIVGDIASPSQKHSEDLLRFFTENSFIFNDHALICNFEGLLSENIDKSQNKPVLYNHPSVLTPLKKGNVKAVCLANNHILDLPHNFDQSIKVFDYYGISFVGATKNRGKVNSPVSFYEKDIEVVLFNACWDFLLYHQQNPTDGIFISEINEENLLKQVEYYRRIKPKSTIVLYFHWSIDLEKLPFPMYRQFSRSLIDAGANLVIGGHSHCVQGGEKYNNGYIVYGLGNFFMPHDVFAQGKIAYPEFSNIELAFEWDSSTKSAKCHWFEYQYNGQVHQLQYIGSDDFESSIKLQEFSPFIGMDDKQYYSYFKKYRRKKILIPIYSNYKHHVKNKIFTILLKSRARVARMLAKMNVINWQN
jgi:poly-gamma-glutamate synthesis protein (capsule biosynthesis protein)